VANLPPNVPSLWLAHWTLPCALLLAALAAGATPKVVGDGGEYFVYAAAMARGHAPPLAPQDLADAKAALAAVDPRFEGWDLEASAAASPSGGRDFVHFWFYPALAAPGAALARLAGVSPCWSFAALNVALLLLAWRLSAARFGWAVSLMVCGGPILWWIDKVHTEAFTFALLTVAVSSLSPRPWLALVALGAAATQNPPIAALLVPFAAAGLWLRRAPRERRATLAGLAGAAALAAVHPAYYLLVHGAPSLIAAGSRNAAPNVSELGAVIWDTNLGLVFCHPLFVAALALALAALLARRPRALVDAELAAAAVAMPALLLAFSQTSNFQHGGTPGLSRYALWLLPLALRPFELAWSQTRARTWLGPCAVASFLVCLVAYHPSVAEKAYRPSHATRWLWTSAPGFFNPLPEVFSETVRGDDEGIHVPVGLPGCEKVLMQGGGAWRPMWPVPCYPAAVPGICSHAGSFCYANRTDRGYAFDPVPRPRRATVEVSPFDAWGQEAEPVVRRLLEGADWPSLRTGAAWGAARFFRSSDNVARTWDLQSDRALVLVVKGARPGARLLLRLPRPMEGPVVDGESGSEIGHAAILGSPYELFELRLPEHRGPVLCVLR
jgi:hypothetical protein